MQQGFQSGQVVYQPIPSLGISRGGSYVGVVIERQVELVYTDKIAFVNRGQEALYGRFARLATDKPERPEVYATTEEAYAALERCRRLHGIPHRIASMVYSDGDRYPFQDLWNDTMEFRE